MNESWQIRRAGEADLAAFAEIVNHYILTTAINFRVSPQQPDDWLAEWRPSHERYPWLVAERDGTIDGIAYATPWKLRNAYDWSVEVTVYVRAGLHGKGIGSALYRELLEELDVQGYRTMVAVIALPNEASVAFHESFGFVHAGTLRGIGYKAGAWRDIGLWQRRTASDDVPPSPIRASVEIGR